MQTLREARRARALSIRALADDAKVSPQTVISAEQGKPIRLQSIRRMAAALGVEPLEIQEFRAIIAGEGASNRASVADEGIGRTDVGIGQKTP